MKNSICRNSSYARSNLKKKNLHGTRVHGARVPYKTPLWDNQNVAIGLAQSNLGKKLHGNSSL